MNMKSLLLLLLLKPMLTFSKRWRSTKREVDYYWTSQTVLILSGQTLNGLRLVQISVSSFSFETPHSPTLTSSVLPLHCRIVSPLPSMSTQLSLGSRPIWGEEEVPSISRTTLGLCASRTAPSPTLPLPSIASSTSQPSRNNHPLTVRPLSTLQATEWESTQLWVWPTVRETSTSWKISSLTITGRRAQCTWVLEQKHSQAPSWQSWIILPPTLATSGQPQCMWRVWAKLGDVEECFSVTILSNSTLSSLDQEESWLSLATTVFSLNISVCMKAQMTTLGTLPLSPVPNHSTKPS